MGLNDIIKTQEQALEVYEKYSEFKHIRVVYTDNTECLIEFACPQPEELIGKSIEGLLKEHVLKETADTGKEVKGFSCKL